ncbi:flotillin family protein [Agromyces sp. SYSU K20354]|uniref:flotillin family protein n=1 Tax=Agromyces cavernae TaxID=2898659 RepID=UPI001E319515|nr:SPFH domain-containing protein [Agromyces cavernae]MCD2443298.1 flotillin family protein [Agromyces cavernae]
MPDLLFSPVFAVIALVIVALIIVWVWAKVLYRNVSPDEAIVVTGKRSRRRVVDGVDTEESGQRVVHGQGVWIMPFFQKAHKISLRSRAIEIRAEAQTNNGITVHVDAVAIVKVGDSAASIRAAAQRFLGQDKNIDMFAQEVLSGSLRASIGATDVLTIINRRDELSAAVLGVARESLVNQGLDVDSFEIKGISDTNGYIDDLGRAEQAKVRKQAEIAEAEAQREAREAVIAAEQTVAEREAELAQRKAALQRETDKATAEAAAARPLAEALSQQEVVAQQEITAQKKAALRAAELDSEVKAVADAQAYKVKVEAEAAADAVRIAADADRVARTASAEALKAEGLAEADAIHAKGAAEAAATKAAAEAVAQQSEALLQMRLIDALPLIARELAAPMSNIDQLTVVSTDGASQLAKNAVSGITEVDAMLSSTMGVGIRELIGSLVGGTAAGAAAATAVARNAEPAPVAGELVGLDDDGTRFEGVAEDALDESTDREVPAVTE